MQSQNYQVPNKKLLISFDIFPLSIFSGDENKLCDIFSVYIVFSTCSKCSKCSILNSVNWKKSVMLFSYREKMKEKSRFQILYIYIPRSGDLSAASIRLLRSWPDFYSKIHNNNNYHHFYFNMITWFLKETKNMEKNVKNEE